MEANNRKKHEKLGMPYGTANGKLRKSLLFHLAVRLDICRCFHCEKYIETVDEFSIEHKIPWLNSNDPVKNFFSLDNIAFSHLKCNVEAGAKMPKLYPTKKVKDKARYDREKNDPERYARKLRLKKEGYHRRKQVEIKVYSISD